MNKYKFSGTSKERLNTCNEKLVELMNTALETSQYDMTIACGYRGIYAQTVAYVNGYSKARWGESRHNEFPSMAIDVYPYHRGRMVNGDKEGDKEIMKQLAKHILRVARDLDIKIKWGGDWENFKDYPHWELAKGE